MTCSRTDVTVPEYQLPQAIDLGYHELRAALYYLHTGQYQKALDEVGDQRGYFHNGGLDINDAIRAYANANK